MAVALVTALDLGVDSTTYRVVLLVHLLVAIAGFGGVLLNGVYAAQAAARPGPEGRAISEANAAVSGIAEWLIYLVPLSGLVLVGVSDGAWSLGDTWVWLSLVAVAAAAVASRAVLLPGHREINRLLAEAEQHRGEGPPPSLAAVEAIGRRQAVVGAGLDLLLVVVLVLMIWKPGT